jgi:hypothetical protein
VQGIACHPGEHGGGPEMNNLKKWKAEEEESYKGSLIPPPQKNGPKGENSPNLVTLPRTHLFPFN